MADRGRSENGQSWLEPTSVNDLNSLPIDVHSAKEKFNALSRQLTNKSADSTRKYIDSTTTSHDPEKGLDADQQDSFDLREYLTSSNDANQKAGIKHKVK